MPTWEQTSTFTFWSIHIIYPHHPPLSSSAIPMPPRSLKPPHSFMNNHTTHPMHHKYHFPPLNLYIHLQTPSPFIDIILAIISWLLEVCLNTVYLSYSLCTYHHVVLVAWISLTLSRHFSLSFIAPGRSSGLYPISSHSCWMYVRAGRPAFARPYVGVHKSTSLMSLSLLLQQCPACLVRLTWIVFVIGGRWPYSWCLVGCCHQDLFKIACSILV